MVKQVEEASLIFGVLQVAATGIPVFEFVLGAAAFAHNPVVIVPFALRIRAVVFVADDGSLKAKFKYVPISYGFY